MDLYLATSNIGKVRELKTMLDGLGIKVHSAEEVGGMPEVEETELTLEGNARLKAKECVKKIPQDGWVLADDSGLFVDALGGRPGVFSARYGIGGDGGNRKRLLEEMKNVPEGGRGAEFVCCFVLLHGLEEFEFKGLVRGRIGKEEKGVGGFGYDSVFIPEGQSMTFAEMDAELKNRISHRGEAIRQLISWLKKETF